jgi:hypothetical protein
MGEVLSGSFQVSKLICPVCKVDLRPPNPTICDHIAFYLVHGPADEPFFEFLHPDYELSTDKILSTGSLKRISGKYEFDVYVLDEEDANYPTQIILGLRNSD